MPGSAAAAGAGEQGAGIIYWTLRAFGFGALAEVLAVALEEEVGAGAGVELLGDIGLDGLLGFTVGDAVIFALLAALDAHEDVGAVGGNGGDRRDAGKEQDAVGAGIGDIGKLFEELADLGERADEGGTEVVAILILHAGGDLLEAQRAELGDHAAGAQGSG